MAIEVGLIYKGKKAPITLENARYAGKSFLFPDRETTVWVPKFDSKILINDNPCMFNRVGERKTEPPEPQIKEEIETIAETDEPVKPDAPKAMLPRPKPSIIKDNIQDTDADYNRRFDLNKFQLEALTKKRYKEDLDRRGNIETLLGRIEWLEEKRLEKIEEDGNVFQGS